LTDVPPQAKTLMVVVGEYRRYYEWWQQQDVATKRRVRRVERPTDMFGFHDVEVVFMRDWTHGKTTAQCRAIWHEAEILTSLRARMMRPFQPPRSA
jgi:hypothetical protein